jgi:hypothetical protein
VEKKDPDGDSASVVLELLRWEKELRRGWRWEPERSAPPPPPPPSSWWRRNARRLRAVTMLCTTPWSTMAALSAAAAAVRVVMAARVSSDSAHRATDAGMAAGDRSRELRRARIMIDDDLYPATLQIQLLRIEQNDSLTIICSV